MIKKMVNYKNKKMERKGQTFSADLIIVVIIILIGVLFLVLGKINSLNYEKTNPNEITKRVDLETNKILGTLKEDDIINENNEIEAEKLKVYSYDELKSKLGLSSDFAIVLEKDGKLVKIDPESDVFCIGTDKIIVNGQKCLKK